MTIFGGWGAYEQGWAAVEPRLDWAAARYAEGWPDRENLLEGVDQDVAFSVDIERSGGRFDNAPRSPRGAAAGDPLVPPGGGTMPTRRLLAATSGASLTSGTADVPAACPIRACFGPVDQGCS